MTSVAATTTPPPRPLTPPANALGRGLAVAERWLETYSQAAVRIAYVLTVACALLATGALAGNVFTRYVLGYSIFGAEEIARWAFIWTIWMGVSLAVKRGAVTVITIVSHHGPAWWQRSTRAFSSVSLGVLLAYTCVRATEFASGSFALGTSSPALGESFRFSYAIAAMAVGYYFITLHYLCAVVRTAREGMEAQAAPPLSRPRTLLAAAIGVFALLVVLARAGLLGDALFDPVAAPEVLVPLLVATAIAGLVALGQTRAAQGMVGGAVLGGLVWLAAYLLIEAGASELIAVGLIFVCLVLAGTPIVFMLSIVGIIATLPSFLGLTFYPDPNLLFPFSTVMFTMGLSRGTELLVILMFLIVAEVMNASGMSDRLIRFAAALVGHLRGGMAYVCQLTSALVSGISGSAQADAAVMTPLLVPAMEKEGYPRDVAAAVVAGASIKGPIGPISIMFIVYGFVVEGVSINALLLSGIFAEVLLLAFQAATVYVVVRRLGFFTKRRFAGIATVAKTGAAALPLLFIPIIIIGGIFFGGVFTPTESAPIAALITIGLALFWYASIAPRDLPRVIAAAGLETGIVMLLVADSNILGTALQNDSFGASVSDFFTSITDNKYVFLLVVNLVLLAVGIFIEPLPAVFILAPFLAPVAETFGVDPVHFGLIMVFNLVLALIHPPIGLVLFLVSSISRVSIERLSIVILPWLAVSLVVLFLVTYLPASAVLALSHLLE